MAEVFADTSGWAEFFDRSQPFHTKAVSLIKHWRSQGTRVVTTNYVLAELASLLISPLRIPRLRQIAIVHTIQTAYWTDSVHLDPFTDKRGHYGDRGLTKYGVWSIAPVS